MVELVVLAVLAVLTLLLVRARRRRRRTAEPTYVPTYPTIELEQPYGGRDADPLNARGACGVPRVLLIARHGPPSQWGRLY